MTKQETDCACGSRAVSTRSPLGIIWRSKTATPRCYRRCAALGEDWVPGEPAPRAQAPVAESRFIPCGTLRDRDLRAGRHDRRRLRARALGSLSVLALLAA